VPAYAGVPITHRGVSKAVTVVTGQSDPWAAPDTDWDAVARLGGTVVLYMSVRNRSDIAEKLLAAGMDPHTPVVAITSGTRPEQMTVRTTLSGLGTADVAAPATIVIGAVAALDLAWRPPAGTALAGRTIVVTAPGQLAERLQGLGATVVHAEAIAVVAAADGGAALASARMADYDWVVFSSGNAVERFPHDLVGVPVAAVGPATAEAATARGASVQIVPNEAVADALVDAFPDGPGRVLLPQAAAARPTLREGLRAKGWDVDAIEAYRTVPVPLTDAQRVQASSADAIAFTSSSTVVNYLGAGGAIPAVVVCIGPVTAAAAKEHGLRVTAVAAPHSVDGLVAAIVASLS